MLKRKLMLLTAALLAGVGMVAPAFAETVTVRIAKKDFLTTNPVDVAHVERIEQGLAAKGLDINIELVDIPSSNYPEALSLRLLSGDIPDLIFFQGGHEKIAAQGILEDWRPWIETAPNLKAALWPHNVGRLDNYPYLLYVYPVRTKSAVIRTDWLEQTGLEAPVTLDEWTNLLRAVRDGDLDGDGQDNTYGIVSPDTTDELDALFNVAFGITETWMKNEAGEWVHSRVSDEQRDKLAYYRDLVAEGLLDPEYITTNWEVKEDKFYTGRVGVVMGTAGNVVSIYQAKMQQLHPGVELTMLEPPKGVDQGMVAIDISTEERGFALSAVSEHKEEVMAVLDYIASPEGQMLDRIGFEGEEYTKEGDVYTPTEKMNTWSPRFYEINFDTWSPPFENMAPIAFETLEQGAKYYRPDNAFVFPPEFAADLDATNNLYRSYVYRFLTGEVPLEQWDSYVAEWNAAGGARMTEYARTQLDAAN